jgi:MFS family permease
MFAKKKHHSTMQKESVLTASTSATSSLSDDVSTTASTPSLSKQQQQQEVSGQHRHHRSSMLEIPYTISLPLLVFVDMMGVSLVVPLLHSQYFQLAGVTSAAQREWLSSIFSASQIVGGLSMGALSDSGLVSRQWILLTSFVGSAFAYAMILQGGWTAILISRVTVGLVKQTMTVTTALMAHATHGKERATHVGRYVCELSICFYKYV